MENLVIYWAKYTKVAVERKNGGGGCYIVNNFEDIQRFANLNATSKI